MRFTQTKGFFFNCLVINIYVNLSYFLTEPEDETDVVDNVDDDDADEDDDDDADEDNDDNVDELSDKNSLNYSGCHRG